MFLVERLRDGAHLALKFADSSVSEDSEVLYRFVEEYGLLEQVHHPNVLQIYDQGVTDDALFIVMEYLSGGTLKQRIGSKGMEPERAWSVLREMVQALVEVHRHGHHPPRHQAGEHHAAQRRHGGAGGFRRRAAHI